MGLRDDFNVKITETMKDAARKIALDRLRFFEMKKQIRFSSSAEDDCFQGTLAEFAMLEILQRNGIPYDEEDCAPTRAYDSRYYDFRIPGVGRVDAKSRRSDRWPSMILDVWKIENGFYRADWFVGLRVFEDDSIILDGGIQRQALLANFQGDQSIAKPYPEDPSKIVVSYSDLMPAYVLIDTWRRLIHSPNMASAAASDPKTEAKNVHEMF